VTGIRPRRGVLYAPGGNARMLEKARQLDADAVIFDLEDSVAPEVKREARELACAAMATGGFGFREVAIRLNPPASPWFLDDLVAAGAARPDAIVLSKVEGIEDILQAERLLDMHEVAPAVRLWAMIETPLGLLNVRDIASLAATGRSRRLAGLVLGTNDIAKDTGVQPGPDRAPLVPWLLQAVLVARAFGLFVLDGVFNAFADVEGFERECAQGRELGFDGKTLIHPSQIACANRTFAPRAEEVEEARAIIDAFALPENRSKGAINLNGRMVERLHAGIAARTLAMDERIRTRGPARA
jgi:citrate lyase subunit beta/citryl-CoA lyase